jgi:hypothetical protein
MNEECSQSQVGCAGLAKQYFGSKLNEAKGSREIYLFIFSVIFFAWFASVISVPFRFRFIISVDNEEEIVRRRAL